MQPYVFEREQFIARPIDETFSFFNRPENLAHITPTTLGFKLLTPSPIQMTTGTLIDYVIRIGGIPVRWTSAITDYAPPFKFVDTQLRGPYAFWHHSHTFQERGNGTVVKDTIHYLPPLGFLGRIVNALFVKRQLKKIFDYRFEVIEKLFEVELVSTQRVEV